MMTVSQWSASMPWGRNAIALVMSTLSLSGLGCAYEVAPDQLDDAPIASATEEITRGTLTSRPRWVVELDLAHWPCSGSVLSERWILTAAHCIEGSSYGNLGVTIAPTPGGRQEIYRGPAQYYVHPDYSGNAMHDVALVRLTARGLDLSQTGRANLYTDARRPWFDADLPDDFLVVGWGLGSDGPTGTTDCDQGNDGKMRIGYGFDLKFNPNVHYVDAFIGETQTCAGDSGAPWLLRRGSTTTGYDYFLFAVHSGKVHYTFADDVQRASLLGDNLGWIEAIMRTEGTYGNICAQRTFSGYLYEQCEDYTWGSLPVRGLGGKCMEAGGTTAGSLVRLNACSSSNTRQRWSMMPSGAIQSGGASNLCLYAGSTTNGTQLELRTCIDILAQRFVYQRSGQIRSASDTNKCVEVKGGFTTNMTPIQMYSCNGTSSQWWSW